jgi:hypothetical protein
MRHRRRLRQIPCDAFDLPLLDLLKDCDEAVYVHGLSKAIFDRLVNKWVIRDLPITDNVFKAGELIRENGCEKVFRLHAL